ncbi:hypothetical protein [Prosthecodimorpha staleyi]|uniref:Uncharacterized protein n=1 Tax=Prosthecodimorpha staleyi TaxID=2840188 RepID=A0A947D6Q2_9HYPH|nr:hypothetical protein [Prosthecodimorpha staleyi]MBT9290576.1 hypothetical protein [Prosthecodimorpha staleyi]
MQDKIDALYAALSKGYHNLQRCSFEKNTDPFRYAGYNVQMLLSRAPLNIESGTLAIRFIDVDGFRFQQEWDTLSSIDALIERKADPGRYRYRFWDAEQSDIFELYCEDFDFEEVP